MIQMHERVRTVTKAELDFSTAVFDMEAGGNIELSLVIEAVLACLHDHKTDDPLIGTIRDALAKVVKDHSLTLGETRGVVLSQAQSLNKYCIRYERHGNYEKKGGEA